ncbi:NAD(P)/FAD-dependent oxidoreductase [Gynurincola endophyticus]|uniref:NAD(P)/FAD-dependent oxidoreductase n=1 Tax=Gynurincola endophyticus TaxID=2479004 RepID=UPI000F8D25F5|nr:FAD-binding oxidoreductase [Gynurincola endophyticus]
MDLKSNEPFWLVKNGLLASYPSLHENISCDVLIVGGGITGSLIAYQCIRDGYNTVLIDKREVCNGSSSATTSMLQYEIDVPLYELIEKIGEKGALASYDACCKAVEDLGKIAHRIKSASGFQLKQSLYYAASKKDAEWLQKEFEARSNAGYDVRWLEPDTVLSKYGIHHNYGAILSAAGGSVDAYKLAHELLLHSYKKGLRVFDKTTLESVQYKKGFNLGTVTGGAVIKAKNIVYCTGYETAGMIKEKFVKLLSSFAIVSEIDKDLYRQYKDILIWNTSKPYLYMRATDDGRFLIGGEDEDFKDPVKRDAMLKEKEQKLLKSFAKIFPDKQFYSDFAWAGTFGETKDGLPYIGEHPDFKRSYFVGGFGGNGITFSVTGMEMVSHWLKGKKHLLSEYFRFGR